VSPDLPARHDPLAANHTATPEDPQVFEGHSRPHLREAQPNQLLLAQTHVVPEDEGTSGQSHIPRGTGFPANLEPNTVRRESLVASNFMPGHFKDAIEPMVEPSNALSDKDTEMGEAMDNTSNFRMDKRRAHFVSSNAIDEDEVCLL
jgi:hypothetical protein